MYCFASRQHIRERTVDCLGALACDGGLVCGNRLVQLVRAVTLLVQVRLLQHTGDERH